MKGNASKRPKRPKKKEPEYNDNTQAKPQRIRVKRITADGKWVVKGTPGGDYLLDIDNNVLLCK